ncbi:hypothetical protein, partial [Escherichia coli]|uniref:hypothetical protein n=1 Tax=Escherichia coli TaxID=562 RepID=UPI001BDDAEE2
METLFHPFQAFIVGQKAMAPKLAATFGIPLVFYGEHEGEYGNPRATTASATRSAAYHSGSHSIYLAGVSTDEL